MSRLPAPVPKLAAALALAAVAAPVPALAGDALIVQLDGGGAAGWAGYARALSQGYYAAEGLEVSLRAPDGDAPTAALARGLADVALDWTAPALIARAQGLPVVQIAQLRPGAVLTLVCRRDLGVNSPADLPGKTVATWTGGREAALTAYLAAQAVDPASVRIVARDTGLTTLTDSRAHCITVTGDPARTLAAAGFPPQRLASFPMAPAAEEAGLFALAPALNEPARADALARFLRASRKGWADLGRATGDWTPSAAEAAQLAARIGATPAPGFTAALPAAALPAPVSGDLPAPPSAAPDPQAQAPRD